MSGPRYPYVAVDVVEDGAEDAAALLFELGATGVEWRDATTLGRSDAGRVRLIASFDREEDARAAARELPPSWSPQVDEVVGDSWRDEWKKYFEPFRIAGPIVVSPPWIAYTPSPGERVIVLEPGRAFGTGLHETTSVVAEALVDHVDRFGGLGVLDVGCGSGILSLVALALGAASARAIDTDPDAVLVTRENAARNAAGTRLRADDSTMRALLEQDERYAVVVANIEAQTLVALAPALEQAMAPLGLLILGGILAPEVAPAQLSDIRRAYGRLKEIELRRKGEWLTFVWSK
jgi:ribosomal protein L11 methyltransferase